MPEKGNLRTCKGTKKGGASEANAKKKRKEKPSWALQWLLDP